jgi:hypothetical protein
MVQVNERYLMVFCWPRPTKPHITQAKLAWPVMHGGG